MTLLHVLRVQISALLEVRVAPDAVRCALAELRREELLLQAAEFRCAFSAPLLLLLVQVLTTVHVRRLHHLRARRLLGRPRADLRQEGGGLLGRALSRGRGGSRHVYSANGSSHGSPICEPEA